MLATIGSKFPALGDDQSAMKTKIFSAYRGKVPLGESSELVSRSMADVFKTLEGRFGRDVKLISNDEIKREYSSYCRITVAFYEEVLRLPSSTRVAVLRKLFS